MSLTMTGVAEMRVKLNAIGSASATTQAAGKALYKVGNQIITAAKQETPVGGPPYSPYDKAPGTLRASGMTDVPIISGKKVSVTMGFGGAASAYAVPQHFRLDYRHHVGKALYLQDPFNQIAPSARQEIVNEVYAHITSTS